jgi:hypothetical protein
MSVASKVAQARIALAQGEWQVVEGAVRDVAARLGFKDDEPSAATATGSQSQSQTQAETAVIEEDEQTKKQMAELLPASLQIQFLLIFCLFNAHMGDVKLAKGKLRKAHQLLDAPEGEGSIGRGEKEGWVTVRWLRCGSLRSTN